MERRLDDVGVHLRAGRRTNVALLAVLPAAFATGWLAFAVGAPGPARIVAVAHGIAGMAVIVLVPWKSVVVRRAVARSDARMQWLSTALGVLVALAVLAGVLHSVGGYRAYVGVTPMQLHVGAALVAAPLFLAHVIRHRQRPQRTDLTRRNLLKAAALGAAATASYASLEAATAVLSLPGRSRRATGSHEVGSGEPRAMPITQWLDDKVPSIDPAGWRLTVVTGSGIRTYEYEEIAAGGDAVRAVLDCTGGWYAEQEWHGLWVSRLLNRRGSGRSIDVRSATGYWRRFPIDDAEHLLLATAAAGQPLSPGHGAPVRLVAPTRRGFWWVKWVERIEVRNDPWWWQPPYPLS